MKKHALIPLYITALITLTQAKLHHYEFNITSTYLNPDCHHQGYTVPLVNGQFPGPAIHVNQGDEVEILVRNLVQSHNTSIHYHGIRQIGTVEADGVPGITQHAISPNKTYLHKFKVHDQAGTYFYHAHVGLQDDSVKGAFIVYESDKANPASQRAELQAGPYKYKKDLILQMSEWWHDDLKSREDYYLSNQFKFDHGADSILINGRTVFDPNAKGLSEKNCQGYTTFDVEPNTAYRLRIIGATTFRTLAIGVKDHNMTLIEIDGELTHPYNTSYLEVAPGQRYSALLQTGDHPPGTTFAIGTSYVWRQRGHGITENGFGYIRYTAPSQKATLDPKDTNLFKPIHRWDQHALEPRAEWLGDRYAQDHPSNYQDQEVALSTSYMKMADNTTRYMVNNRIMSQSSVPRLLKYDTSKQTKMTANLEYNPHLDTYPIRANETIDLVFQNTVNPVGGCLIHPWHTHGHSHYLIASGEGKYEHARDKDIRNFKFPLYRDTTNAYPSLPTNDTDGCGWTKVRFIADNPGFWAVHCHITTHMIQGKMIVLEEAPELIQKYQRYKK
ncbi:multicopper oxidase [Mucor lusitanicus CBS 277.49]|uniref:Multicopper oxidase n=1 Tax=Mucor lusitanicus CBS 277.49 TaxID=747725 RepID=A0A168L023_MUCCL|nr:multicopper oxidase [Mucor lusitanicus CBS 277.49]